ncbi:hypothetical protein ON010_g9210 [Phytophthora cinnamomi]|nr:hypothetical protein ON010_g9210 [Phytophthora cinnamomi]
MICFVFRGRHAGRHPAVGIAADHRPLCRFKVAAGPGSGQRGAQDEGQGSPAADGAQDDGEKVRGPDRAGRRLSFSNHVLYYYQCFRESCYGRPEMMI